MRGKFATNAVLVFHRPEAWAWLGWRVITEG